MVACKKILNYEGEVENTLSYINFNNITKGKAKKNAKKKFFVFFTSTDIPKKALFWPFFCPTCKMRFLFLLLKALFFSIRLIFFTPTSKLCLWLLKKLKEHLDCLLGTAFIIKSKTHAHSDEKIAFSITFWEIALVTNTSMKLVYSYVFLITYFHHNQDLSPKQGSEMHKGENNNCFWWVKR